MNGSELVNMCYANDGLEARVSGSYLAGFIHGHIAADARIPNELKEIFIPNNLDANQLKKIVIETAKENPEWLDLDVGTFLYAIFDKHYLNNPK